MLGEVWLCRFPLTSGATGKVRPALALFDLRHDVIICRVTSANCTGLLDVIIAEWRQAGLLLPSVARLDGLVTAERAVLTKRLGTLSAGDLERVRERWNDHMQL